MLLAAVLMSFAFVSIALAVQNSPDKTPDTGEYLKLLADKSADLSASNSTKAPSNDVWVELLLNRDMINKEIRTPPKEEINISGPNLIYLRNLSTYGISATNINLNYLYAHSTYELQDYVYKLKNMERSSTSSNINYLYEHGTYNSQDYVYDLKDIENSSTPNFNEIFRQNTYNLQNPSSYKKYETNENWESSDRDLDYEPINVQDNSKKLIKSSYFNSIPNLIRLQDSYSGSMLSPDQLRNQALISDSSGQIAPKASEPVQNMILPDFPISSLIDSYKYTQGGPIVKNQAIIIGIDQYKDRMSLHNSVNDAETVAEVFKSLGYDVIELTDSSGFRPTKHNILDEALSEIKSKPNIGKIVFYFSGHGECDNGNFYLIPSDADGSKSTYISEDELRRYTKDIKNLALIIDACNSGALFNITSDSQLLIASSGEQEPSNEEWTGSLSVFTGYLCNAIMEERRNGYGVVLQDCFKEASSKTIEWSKDHLLGSQTPVIDDKTSTKRFYLN